jgi:hypothetical protein
MHYVCSYSCFSLLSYIYFYLYRLFMSFYCYCHVSDHRKSRGKGKVRLRTGYEGPEGELRYSSTLSLTSALDGVGGQSHAPSALTPGNTRYPLYGRLGAVTTEKLTIIAWSTNSEHCTIKYPYS